MRAAGYDRYKLHHLYKQSNALERKRCFMGLWCKREQSVTGVRERLALCGLGWITSKLMDIPGEDIGHDCSRVDSVWYDVACEFQQQKFSWATEVYRVHRADI